LLLNGVPFGGSEYQTGDVHALPLSPGSSPVRLGSTHWEAYDRPVLPGSYQPAYAHVVGAGGIPRNTFTTFGAPVRVDQGDGGEMPPLDLLAADLLVSYEHNGAAMPEGGPDVYKPHLQRGVNYLQLLDSSYGPNPWTVMEGTFDLFYQYRGGPNLPKNAFMRFGCWEFVHDGLAHADPPLTQAGSRPGREAGAARDARRRARLTTPSVDIDRP
jgi:hypothetical protein